MADEQWVRLDAAEDVVGSLAHALRTFAFVAEDVRAWKWVMLALHAALQGACVCHLVTTMPPLGAVTKKNAAEWLAFWSDRTGNNAAPSTKLLDFTSLLRAVRKPDSAGSGKIGSGITLSDADFNYLGDFHRNIRNQFVHYEPISVSFDIAGVPDIARLISRIIEQILKADWAFRNLEERDQESLTRDLAALRRLGASE